MWYEALPLSRARHDGKWDLEIDRSLALLRSGASLRFSWLHHIFRWFWLKRSNLLVSIAGWRCKSWVAFSGDDLKPTAKDTFSVLSDLIPNTVWRRPFPQLLLRHSSWAATLMILSHRNVRLYQLTDCHKAYRFGWFCVGSGMWAELCRRSSNTRLLACKTCTLQHTCFHALLRVRILADLSAGEVHRSSATRHTSGFFSCVARRATYEWRLVLRGTSHARQFLRPFEAKSKCLESLDSQVS